MAKNQAKPKQHAEVDYLLFENYSFSSSRYYPKIIGDTLENVQKTNTFI